MRDAAAALGVSSHTIRRLIQAGVLPAAQVVPDAPYQIRSSNLHSQAVTMAIAPERSPVLACEFSGAASNVSRHLKMRCTNESPVALDRKSWLFAGSERGAERAAIMYTLIQTAKLNEIDPQAWLADTLSKIADTPQTRLGKLLPWNWMSDRRSRAAA